MLHFNTHRDSCGKILFENYKPILGILVLLFVILSVITSLFDTVFLFRLSRVIVIYIILIFLLAAHGKNLQKWIAGFLFFYGASSITTLWYETGQMASMAMMLNFISFLILLFYIIPKFNFKKMTNGITILFLFIVAINGYLFFQLLDLIKTMTLNTAQYIFMFFNVICALLLAFFALVHNHFANTRTSMVFIFIVFMIVFGEIFRSIAYYNLADSLEYLYLGRFFMIFGLSALVHFSFLERKRLET